MYTVTQQNTAPRKVRVMVVDDSAVIRGFFTNVLQADPSVEIVASLGNGEMALNLLRRQGENHVHVDVVTLDIEMPVMDGLSALPQMLKLSPGIKVIMASSLSTEGAQETMRALQLGAADYIAKPASPKNREEMYAFAQELLGKVKVLGGITPSSTPEMAATKKENKPETAASPIITHVPQNVAPENIILRKTSLTGKKPAAIAIGCSTGGPQALTTLFRALKGKNFKVPVFITQHMPPQFTAMLAQQLTEVSGLSVVEAKDGMTVTAGTVYLAPGDFHMLIKNAGTETAIILDKGPLENFCRPAVDPMLRSLVEVYGDKLLVLIMTGMGADGLKGCQRVVDTGGVVLAQDKATSVVWGMPGAVASAGICTRVEPLMSLAPLLMEFSQGQIL